MTAAGTKGIEALENDVIHKICSDRVIGSLAIAIKELLENSIDAGAKNIGVKIKSYGTESIEVSDDGKGVEEQDFEALVKSYHTSKLTEFTDLDTVSTFGFRGEALSSLCRLCNGLIVITRHSSSQYGSRLEYDCTGKLINKTICNSKIGTTITLNKIFSTLPVRRKVFESKCQIEFTKALQILQAYCIIATGIKIRVLHQKETGKDWSLILNTQGGNLKENLGAVIGHRALSDILSFPGTECEIDQSNDPFLLRGYISTCASGNGRAAPDKQYFYVNGRPCDLPKCSRLINQLYKQYNPHKFPLIVMNVITTEQKSVDVNLAPDKRSIIIKGENELIEHVQNVITSLFVNIPCTIPLNTDILKKIPNTPQDSDKRSRKSLLKFLSSKSSKFNESKSEISDTSLDEDINTSKSELSFNTKLSMKSSSSCQFNLDKFKSPKFSTMTTNTVSSQPLQNSPSQSLSGNINLEQFKFNASPSSSSSSEFLDQFKCPSNGKDNKGTKRPAITANENQNKSRKIHDFFYKTTQSEENDEDQKIKTDDGTNGIEELNQEEKELVLCNELNDEIDELDPINDIDVTDGVMFSTRKKISEQELIKLQIRELNQQEADFILPNESNDDCNEPDEINDIDVTEDIFKTLEKQTSEQQLIKLKRRELIIPQKLQDINNLMKIKYQKKSTQKDIKSSKFKSLIESEDIVAEQELSREIKKEMFLKMKIIGQFNKAFVIAKLDQDIFIIDQHAADEKFNFEKLGKISTKQTQRLIIPHNLELNPMDEIIFLQNQKIFKENGFDFSSNSKAPVSKKVTITAVPSYLHSTFNLDDILDMIFQIQDNTNDKPQPKRIRSMLASKACRQSIMIGTALNHKIMKRIVNNLATMDHPWQCPHGRPTMRHLVNLISSGFK